MKSLEELMAIKNKMADRVSVQLISTDPTARPSERIIKKSEKKGLFAAMDVGAVWLERALAKK